MNQFYVPPDQFAGNLVIIGQEEARHIIKVLRYKEGHEILITDGKGCRYKTVIESTTRRDVQCRIIEKFEVAKPRQKILVQGYIRQRQRLEYAVEKGTETGVTSFIICHTQHAEPGKVKIDRLQHIAVSAMKQSARVWLPEVRVARNLEEAIKATENTTRIVAHEKADPDRQNQINSSEEDLSLWVGPEGGFGDEEIKTLIDRGSEIISLGKYRLRAETAAVVLSSRY